MRRRLLPTVLAKHGASGPTYETPSYANAGGTGDRQLDIQVIGTANLWGGYVNYLRYTIDGSANSQIYPNNTVAVAGEYTRFWFTTARIITEVKLYTDTSTNTGTWKWQASNDASIWTDVSASFALNVVGAGAHVIGDLSANTTAYKYYQLIGVSGNSSWAAYWTQFEFKIGNQTNATTNVLMEPWRMAGAALFNLQSKVGVTNPVITKTFVTDVAGMDGANAYVADPFVALDQGTYYIFFEAYTGSTAYLCCGTSPDLLAWTYKASLTLDGSAWATSYPFIFNQDGYWWMIHDGDVAGHTIKLYRPTNFPITWVTVQTIVTDNAIELRDVSIFQWGGGWYAIAFDATNVNTRLYYCATLTGTWAEHPSSPILTGAVHSRPGGRPIIRPGTGVDILLQDGAAYYGKSDRIFRLTDLTTTTCTATELATSPILTLSGSGWNGAGMHHLDRVSPTISIVDGVDITGINGVYSIGIYEDAP
jgi:hypothetical protein